MIRTVAITKFDLTSSATVWDVRDAKAYAEGHVVGAINQPLDTLTADLLAAVPAGEPVFVLCGGGSKAGRAAALLASFDAERDIVELTGGTRAAKAAGMPIELA